MSNNNNNNSTTASPTQSVKIPYGYVYEIINNINGKTYVGQRRLYCDTLSWRQYMGSGIAVKNAIKKHGKENFTKKFISYAFSGTELDNQEQSYMRAQKALGKAEYNLFVGAPAPTCFDAVKNMTEEAKQEYYARISATRITNVEKYYNDIFDKEGNRIIALYQKHKNVKTVANITKIPRGQIRKFLIKNNIELNSQNEKGRKLSNEKKEEIRSSTLFFIQNNPEKIKYYNIIRDCDFCKQPYETKCNKDNFKSKNYLCSRLCNIKSRKNKEIEALTKSDFEYMYNVLKLTTKEIAGNYNCSTVTVSEAARKSGAHRVFMDKAISK